MVASVVNHTPGPRLSTIRPNPFPSQPQPQPHSAGSDAGRLAAQKAFFALAGLTQSPPSAVAAQPAAPQALASAPTARAPAPSEAPQKIARPGSLFDIRV